MPEEKDISGDTTIEIVTPFPDEARDPFPPNELIVAYRTAACPGSLVRDALPDALVTEYTHLQDQPEDFLERQARLGRPWKTCPANDFVWVWRDGNKDHPEVAVHPDGRIRSTGCLGHGMHRHLCQECPK